MHIKQVIGEAYGAGTRELADVPHFRMLETGGTIATKFGVWLGTH